MMKNNGKYLFSMALILQPLLRLYGLPGIGGTFGDYVIIIVTLYIFFKINGKLAIINSKSEAIELFPIIICVMFNILFTWNSSYDVGNQITYWIRNVLYYLVLFYGSKRFYSIEHGYKVYKIISYVCTAFLIIQTIASSVFGIYIPGQFGPFALTDVELQIEKYNIYSYYNLFRPDSFFREPAHYATFVSCFILLCSLREVNNKNIFAMLFCTFGVLLSGSTAGLVVVSLIWLDWGFRLLKKKGNLKYLFPILILVIVALSIVMRTNSFQIMINRTFNTRDAVNSRFDWLDSLDILKTPLNWMFGMGNSSDVIQLTGWIPGWVMILVDYGIIGVLLFVVAYLLLFLRTNESGRIILTYFIILGFGTEVVADMYVLVILPFVINYTLIKKNNNGLRLETI